MSEEVKLSCPTCRYSAPNHEWEESEEKVYYCESCEMEHPCFKCPHCGGEFAQNQLQPPPPSSVH
jgi:predicted RNA-binding protein with PUA domain